LIAILQFPDSSIEVIMNKNIEPNSNAPKSNEAAVKPDTTTPPKVTAPAPESHVKPVEGVKQAK
jgi:hypothetical protein